jgi:hypothetical protein
VLCVAEQHRIAFALRRAFDALQDLRKRRVGDVGHGDEQLAGLVRPEILCRRVRLKFKAFDRLQDPASRGWCDALGWLRTRETVAVDTPARLATS